MNLHYVHYKDFIRYGIKIISYNLYEIYKDNVCIERCDTFEEAQHTIDNIIFSK